MRNTKTTRRLFTSFLWLAIVCCPLHIFPQEVPELAKKLEKVFEENEPKWRIERPYRQMNPPVMHLKSAQGDILIYFFIQDSEQSAKDVFDGNLIALGNTLGKNKKETKLTSFGDDNRLISDSSGRFADFFFRRGNTYISVLAPTDVIARKFGQYAMKQLLVDGAPR